MVSGRCWAQTANCTDTHGLMAWSSGHVTLQYRDTSRMVHPDLEWLYHRGHSRLKLSAVAYKYMDMLTYPLCFLVYLNECKIHLNHLPPGTFKSFSSNVYLFFHSHKHSPAFLPRSVSWGEGWIGGGPCPCSPDLVVDSPASWCIPLSREQPASHCSESTMPASGSVPTVKISTDSWE